MQIKCLRNSLLTSYCRLADQLHPLHISVSQGNQDAAPPSPESSKELGMNSRNSPAPCSANSSSTSSGGKWSCLVCTYENFPRTGACVLCGARKGRSSPEHIQGVQAEAAARDSPSPEVNLTLNEKTRKYLFFAGCFYETSSS